MTHLTSRPSSEDTAHNPRPCAQRRSSRSTWEFFAFDNTRTFQIKCVTERHKEGVQRNNENYKFKFDWRILNIVTLEFCNIREGLCKAT